MVKIWLVVVTKVNMPNQEDNKHYLADPVLDGFIVALNNMFKATIRALSRHCQRTYELDMHGLVTYA